MTTWIRERKASSICPMRLVVRKSKPWKYSIFRRKTVVFGVSQKGRTREVQRQDEVGFCLKFEVFIPETSPFRAISAICLRSRNMSASSMRRIASNLSARPNHLVS